ncbi:MAG: hypothetical protein JRJ87_11075, partial [Deltaproteobacteria bacterium]|nr:hypothetical protein [Deltaproteobacteria bacterium]
MRAFIGCMISLLFISCSSSNGNVCEPGQRRECNCSSDWQGLQTCKDDGSGWEECECACVPDCDNRECGSDGCNGTCAPGCSGADTCNETSGQCETCIPECTDKCCGDDGCQGQCPDTCPATSQICNATSCQCEGTCQPKDCADLSKECGGPYDDGCGNDIFCEDCGLLEHCTIDGQCESDCEYAVCNEVCCAQGEACCSGSCTPDRCLIDGACFVAGTFDNADHCWVCLPAQDTSAWTFDSHNVTCNVPAHYWEGVS